MAEQHHKHGSGKKANFGHFGRNELSFMGAKCGEINKLVADLMPLLSEQFAVGYLDAEHPSESSDSTQSLISLGATSVVTDKQGHFEEQQLGGENQLNPKLKFTSSDLVLINGNHFEGKHQIVLLQAAKTDSLFRNRHKINDVLFFIDVDGNGTVPDFIYDLNPAYRSLPILSIGENEKISEHILKWMKPHSPKLHGLVLSGGKSTRMGVDKGEIVYHEDAQYLHLAKLLKPFCDEVVISSNTLPSSVEAFNILPDVFLEMGPLGAILTAFKSNPDVAWLMMACDLPMVDEKSIALLVNERSTKQMATSYQRNDGEFPEPLFAIYEPKIYARALQMLSLGIQCPRKLLINSNVKIIFPHNDGVLENVNTPEERKAVMDKIHHDHK